MKKVLSIVLAVLMLAGLAAVSVSAAPEGTAITDAAGFAAMTADGKYYLANDITISATLMTKFKGTFDGNGKTITTSVPVFDEVDGGTIKNLTLAGTVIVEESNKAALVSRVTQAEAGDVVIENVTNNAKVIASGGSYNVAGLVGRIYGTEVASSSLTLKDCTNNADIQGTGHTAGLVAYKDDTSKTKGYILTATNCVNNGNITTTGKSGCGGIFGAVCAGDNNNDKFQVTYLTNCVNNGKITGTQGDGSNAYTGVGGLVGAVSGKAYFEKCKNAGDVAATKLHCGGILATARHAYTLIVIKNCDQIAQVTGTGKVGLVVGYGEKASKYTGEESIIDNYYVTASGAIYGGTEETPYIKVGSAATAPNIVDPTPSSSTDPSTPPTGDSFVVFAMVAVVALTAGTILVVRKKED